MCSRTFIELARFNLARQNAQLPCVDESGFGEHGDSFELQLLNDLLHIAAQDVLGGTRQLAGRHHDTLLVAKPHLHLEN